MNPYNACYYNDRKKQQIGNDRSIPAEISIPFFRVRNIRLILIFLQIKRKKQQDS